MFLMCFFFLFPIFPFFTLHFVTHEGMKPGVTLANMEGGAVGASTQFASLVASHAGAVATALRDALPAAQHTALAAGFVALCARWGIMRPYVETLLDAELAQTATGGTLLRSNSLVSKSMTAFVHLPACTAYLRATLRAPLARLLADDPAALELSPALAAPGADVAANAARLRAHAEAFCAAIFASAPQCPRGLCALCAAIRARAGAKFPDSALLAVANVAILRFFVPAVVTPEDYGFVQDELPPGAHRVLLLVSKCVQNLANGTHFREDFMLPLNDFLVQNDAHMKTFLSSISDPQFLSDDFRPTPPVSPPPAVAAAAAAAAAAVEGGDHDHHSHNKDGTSNQVTETEFYTAVQTIAGWCKLREGKLRIPPAMMDETKSTTFLTLLKQNVAEMERANALIIRGGNDANGASSSQSGASASTSSTGTTGTEGGGPLQKSMSSDKEMKALQKRAKELKKLEQQAARRQQQEQERLDYLEDLMQARKEEREQALRLAGPPMCRAVDAGQVDELQRWLARDRRFVNARCEGGETVLQRACAGHRVDVVRLLLEHDADCYVADDRGWTALHVACLGGDLAVVLELCLHKHLDFAAANDDENTPLHYLVRHPYQALMDTIVARFLAGGADVNAQNINGETPLHNAVWKRSRGAAALLLRHGADPRIRNAHGASPLDWARASDDAPLVALLEHPPVPLRTENSNNPATAAAARLTALSPAQRRAAAWRAVREGDEDTLTALLSIDPALASPATTYGRARHTLLHLAVLYGNERLVRRLLLLLRRKKRTGEDASSDDAATEIDALNAKDAEGNTPLMQAVWMGAERLALVLLLAQRPLDVSALYADGATLLHHAARASTTTAPTLVFALVERGADVDAADAAGCTPLHCAVRCGNTHTVRALLDLGADRTRRNARGETPLDVATRCSHSTLVRMIEPQYYLDQIASFGIAIPPPSPASQHKQPRQQQQQQQAAAETPV